MICNALQIVGSQMQVVDAVLTYQHSGKSFTGYITHTDILRFTPALCQTLDVKSFYSTAVKTAPEVQLADNLG